MTYDQTITNNRLHLGGILFQLANGKHGRDHIKSMWPHYIGEIADDLETVKGDEADDMILDLAAIIEAIEAGDKAIDAALLIYRPKYDAFRDALPDDIQDGED